MANDEQIHSSHKRMKRTKRIQKNEAENTKKRILLTRNGAAKARLFELKTALLNWIFEFLNEQDLMRLQECNKDGRRYAQQIAINRNYIRMISTQLAVESFRCIPMPEERLDIWTNPSDEREYLPQSKLHGRCSALMYVDSTAEGHEDAMESSDVNREMKDERLYIMGGYGLFELWDQNIAMRSNEIWEYNLKSGVWSHPGPMTEDMLKGDTRLRLEDRDAVVLNKSNGKQMLIFGQAAGSRSCFHSFDRVSIVNLQTTSTPFSSQMQWEPTPFEHFPVVGEIPQKRDGFACVLWREPTERHNGWMLLFGGFTPTSKCLDGFYLLEIPFNPLKKLYHPFVECPHISNYGSEAVPPMRYGDVSPKKFEEESSRYYRWRLLGWSTTPPPSPTSAACAVKLNGKCNCEEASLPVHQQHRVGRHHTNGIRFSAYEEDWSRHSQSLRVGNEGGGMTRCPCARFGHSLTKIGDKVYMFGGKGEKEGGKPTINCRTNKSRNKLLQDLWILRRDGGRSSHLPIGWEWEEVQCTGCIPRPRSDHSVVAVGLTLLLFGGNTGRYSNELFALNTGTLVWSMVDVSAVLQKNSTMTQMDEEKTAKKRCTERRSINGNNEAARTPSTQLSAHPLCHNIGDIVSMSGFQMVSQLWWTHCKTPVAQHRHYNTMSPSMETRRTSCNRILDLTNGEQRSMEDAHETQTYLRALPNTVQVEVTTPSKVVDARSTPKTKKRKKPEEEEQFDFPIAPRMDPSMVFNGRDLLYIYGGCNRYRWNGTNCKFTDFLTDCYILKLTAASEE